MLSLQAQTRKIIGKKVESLRSKGFLPAVVYGPKIENQALILDYKDFENAYKQAGEATIINLKIEKKEIPVLVKEVSRHPVTEKFVHVDFYQPKLEDKIVVTIPLVFEGEAPGVKELEAILIKNISEIEIKALPQYLIQEILVDLSSLKTFDDTIQVKDLKAPSEVEILKEPEETVALLSRPKQEVIEKPVEITKEAPTEKESEVAEKIEKKKEEA